MRPDLTTISALTRAPAARKQPRAKAPSSAALERLAARLRELIALFGAYAIDQARFVPTRPVTVDAASGRCSGMLVDAPVAALTIELGDYENRALAASCSYCAKPNCWHIAALAARLLDACIDPADHLREALEKYVRTPSWRRFLDVATAREEPDKNCYALHFLLRRNGSKLDIGVLRESERRGQRSTT